MVWHDLGLNPGLLDHWRPSRPMSWSREINTFLYYIFLFYLAPSICLPIFLLLYLTHFLNLLELFFWWYLMTSLCNICLYLLGLILYMLLDLSALTMILLLFSSFISSFFICCCILLLILLYFIDLTRPINSTSKLSNSFTWGWGVY